MPACQEKKKFNAYEDIWVKCEVGPNDTYIFSEIIGKGTKLKGTICKNSKENVRGKVALFHTKTHYEAMIIRTV